MSWVVGNNVGWDASADANRGSSDQWNDGFGGDQTASAAAFEDGGNDHDDSTNRGPGACFNCGEEGHMKSECPNARSMKCNHCGDEGHMIRDCPTAPPREFTGECRVCGQQGHMAKDCPEKPAQQCRNCLEEGHMALDCKNPRKIDRSGVQEVLAEAAWDEIKVAVERQDLDEAKEAVQKYVKAVPESTYVDIEKAFRDQEIDLFFMALEKPLLSTYTNMDFQGNLGRKYTVSYRFDDKPGRPREKAYWPSSPEENMERLKDAGEVVDCGLIKCNNCGELGHSKKNCKQEIAERERVVIKCFNCGLEGHRVRDCPDPRVDKFACKNCGNGGHKAADCPEPRAAGDDVECHKCNETGHFARDCPKEGGGRACFNCGQEGHSSRDCTEPRKITCRNCDGEGHRASECPEPKNMSKVQCRNCDEYGHGSRDCPKPRDYSRVECQNCGEKGHTKVRCTKTTAALDDDFNGGGGDSGFGAGGSADFGSNTAAGGGADNWGSGDVSQDAGGW